MLRRRFMPPEYFLTRSSARPVRPMISSSSSDRFFACVLSMPCSPAIRLRFSRALRNSAIAVSCGDTAITRFTDNGSCWMSCPRIVAVPPVGRSRQQSILMVVVLPAPFGPSREKSSPSSMDRSMPSTATKSSNDRDNPTVWMAGLIALLGTNLPLIPVGRDTGPKAKGPNSAAIRRSLAVASVPGSPCRNHCGRIIVMDACSRH